MNKYPKNTQVCFASQRFPADCPPIPGPKFTSQFAVFFGYFKQNIIIVSYSFLKIQLITDRKLKNVIFIGFSDNIFVENICQSDIITG